MEQHPRRVFPADMGTRISYFNHGTHGMHGKQSRKPQLKVSRGELGKHNEAVCTISKNRKNGLCFFEFQVLDDLCRYGWCTAKVFPSSHLCPKITGLAVAFDSVMVPAQHLAVCLGRVSTLCPRRDMIGLHFIEGVDAFRVRVVCQHAVGTV